MAFQVFISYRRETGGQLAQLVDAQLRSRGYRTYLDVNDLRSGHFDEQLLTVIENTQDFVVVLTPGDLNRCHDEGDWLRRELAHAIATGRNIVPVFGSKIEYPESLPTDIAALRQYQAVEYSHQYSPGFLNRLLDLLTPRHRYFPAFIDRLLASLTPRKETAIAWRHDVRSKARLGLIAVTALMLLTALVVEVLGPRYSKAWVSANVFELIGRNQWITFDPPRFDPSTERRLNPDTIDTELRAMHDAGFTGLVTYTARMGFPAIARKAKAMGFKVIIGIWDPIDRQEVAAALAERAYADAYCVGHDGFRRYGYDALEVAIQRVRLISRLPVSTTEPLASYLGEARLLAVGDWIFPDARVTETADPIEAATKTATMARRLAVANARRQPILLTFVTFPVPDATGASLDEQRRFYSTLLTTTRGSQQTLPMEVGVAVHLAFDVPWRADWPFYQWYPHPGLLEGSGTPRPAVRAIVGAGR